MNNRIKELSRQAVISIRANKNDLPPLEESMIERILELREEYDKKFTELIVKECGKLLAQPEFLGRSDLDWSMILNEHFGVK